MPRAIWSGTISFGLVSVPVRMYSAIDEADLHFHLDPRARQRPDRLPEDLQDGGRAGPGRRDREGLRAREGQARRPHRRGLRGRRRAEGVKTIEISDFVPYEEIDPIYFERTYYLGPQEGGEKVYSLLREAMEQTEPRRDRQVRDARAAASRLPARARGRDHARATATSTTRSGRRRGSRPRSSQVTEGRARDGDDADRAVLGLVRTRSATRTPTARRCSRSSRPRRRGRRSARRSPTRRRRRLPTCSRRSRRRSRPRGAAGAAPSGRSGRRAVRPPVSRPGGSGRRSARPQSSSTSRKRSATKSVSSPTSQLGSPR